jgi:hypothetical protein
MSKHNQERAKQQPVDPETRHLQLVRSSELERAVEKAFRSMDENHHGAALKLTPPPAENVVSLDDYRQRQAMQDSQPTQTPGVDQEFADNVVSLADPRQRVAQALAEQENQLNTREMFDAPEAA